jgi:ankyrin repeat protein
MDPQTAIDLLRANDITIELVKTLRANNICYTSVEIKPEDYDMIINNIRTIRTIRERLITQIENRINPSPIEKALDAISLRDLQGIKMLIENGLNVNSLVDGDDNLLLHALRQNEKDISNLLIDYGADIYMHTENIEKDDIFLDAVSCGCYAVVKLMLDNNDVEINKKTYIDYNTPLMIAVMHGHVDVVKLLLNRGADPDIKLDNGNTALTLAKWTDKAAQMVELFK